MVPLDEMYLLWKKVLEFLNSGGIIILNRWKARVMPESKFSISGIKNGIPILFSYWGDQYVFK